VVGGRNLGGRIVVKAVQKVKRNERRWMLDASFSTAPDDEIQPAGKYM
jgi:hypothetical protein